MGEAYSKTCDVLGFTKCTDTITTLVARKIIELAERGLRNPAMMHRRAITELELNPHPTRSVNGTCS
jgi:hypothetical protein